MQRLRLLPSSWSSKMYLFPSRVIPFSSQPVGSVLGVRTRQMLGTGGRLVAKLQPEWSNCWPKLLRSGCVAEGPLGSKDTGEAAGEATEAGVAGGEETGVMMTLWSWWWNGPEPGLTSEPESVLNTNGARPASFWAVATLSSAANMTLVSMVEVLNNFLKTRIRIWAKSLKEEAGLDLKWWRRRRWREPWASRQRRSTDLDKSMPSLIHD